ncbi:MAG: WD40 repeat protein, partial [Pirellulaceae bacterium]
MKRANCEHKILTILLAAVLLTPMFAEIGGPFSASTAQEPTPPPQLQYLEGSESSMLSVGYGVGGKTIAGASANGRIYFWDSVDNRLIAQLAGCTGPIVSTAPSPNGLQLASGSRNGLVRIFDIPTVHPLGTITGFAGLPTSIVVSPDGKLILTGDQSKAIRLWDGTNHQNLRNFASIEAITDIAMDTKQRIVFGTSIDGSLQGWNLDDGQLQGRVLTVASNALAAHPAGHTVALAGNDGVLRIVNWPPQPMRNIVQQGGVVVASAISHDDKLIVTGSHDQTVRTFNAETGAAIHSLAGHVGQSITVAISDDAKLIASG